MPSYVKPLGDSLLSSFAIVQPDQNGYFPSELSSSFKHSIRYLQDYINSPANLKDSSRTEVISNLVDFFGEDLVGRALAFRPVNSWGKQLDRNQKLQLLAMIGHAATVDDMQLLWNKIRGDRKLLDFFRFDYLNENTENVKELPSADFSRLLQIIRNPFTYLDLYDGSTHLWDELSFYEKIDDKRWMAYTRYDCEINKLLQKADFSRPEFAFSAPEQIAKAVAYAHPQSHVKGMVIPVFRKESSEIVFYELVSKINKEGLHTYLFTPIGRNDVPAQLVFRGTNGLNSANRDTDTAGVGKTVFEKYSDEIYSMVSSYARSSHNGKIEIIGHSLGAADAQRGAELLLDRYVNGDRSINDIKMYAYCSPKLDKQTASRWEQNVQAMASMEERCQIELNFAEHTSDLVTWAGDKNLLGNASCDFINANYLVVSSGCRVLNPVRHHCIPFFKHGNFDYSTDERSFKLFQSGPFKQMQQRLRDIEDKRSEPLSQSVFNGTAESGNNWVKILKDDEFESKLTEEEKSTKKQLEDDIKTLKKQEVKIEKEQKGWAQQSWFAWSASCVGQGLKKAASYTLSAVTFFKG